MLEKKTIFLRLELAFKVLYLLDVLISFNGFFAGTKYITYFNYFLVAFGAVLLLNRALHFKNFIKMPYIILLVLFGVSMAISALLNKKFGLMENVQSIIWTTIQFGLLYACDSSRSADEYKKEFKILALVFCIYVFIANLIGIGMFVFDYGVRGQYSPNNDHIIGFVWGRLWGVYLDPNNGSVLAAASVVLSICAFINAKGRKPLRALLILNVFLDYAYIMLSDSRTGMVSILAGVTITVYLLIRNNSKMRFNSVLRKIICLAISVSISITSFMAFEGLKVGYNSVAEKIYLLQLEKDPDGADKKPNLITGRDTADTESDISNRRFSLWNSGIEIWKTAPVFGVSQRNITVYAKENVPDTYMVNNDMSDFDSTHNLFIDTLVSQGVVGFAVLILFFIGIAVFLVRKLFIDKEKRKKQLQLPIVAMIGLLAVFACSSMFVLDVLYLNSATTVMFWAILGYLVYTLGSESAAKSTFFNEE